MNANLKKPSMLMLLGGNILAIIGCFLPFVSVFGYSLPFFEGDGKIVVALCAVSLVLAFFKAKSCIVLNIIALIVVLIDIFQAADFSLDVLGIGAYVIVIANIVAIIGGFKHKKA